MGICPHIGSVIFWDPLMNVSVLSWLVFISVWIFVMLIFSFLVILLFYRWDIIAERLGFMLVFGDVVFIPFTFSIQACYNSVSQCQNCFITFRMETVTGVMIWRVVQAWYMPWWIDNFIRFAGHPKVPIFLGFIFNFLVWVYRYFYIRSFLNVELSLFLQHCKFKLANNESSCLHNVKLQLQQIQMVSLKESSIWVGHSCKSYLVSG